MVEPAQTCRELVELARANKGLYGSNGLVMAMADKLEWLAKSYGLWFVHPTEAAQPSLEQLEEDALA